MEPIAIEWLNLLVRWVHVIAAIMWIGDSFLFMWMDSSLEPPSRPRDGAVVGELWMVHSGGFYEVVKRQVLAPAELPRQIHWFKWQAYTTWLSGFALLGIVYYLNRGLYLVDPTSSSLHPTAAIALSVGALALAWLVYDAIWMSPLAARPRLAATLSFALLLAATFGATRVFSARAAFLQVGAMLGTIMAANVWRRIIPAQDRMLAATRAGTAVDVSLGARAKTRSVHNHYLTLPVLFTMLSNHFPSTYGHPLNWLVLSLLIVFGIALKQAMNARRPAHALLFVAGLLSLAGAVALTARPGGTSAAPAGLADGPAIAFADVRAIVDRRCITCHSAHPTNPSFPQPPSGIALDRPEQLRALAPRILVRAVVTQTMPLGNLTGMTDEERRTLGAWIAQGARLDASSTPR